MGQVNIERRPTSKLSSFYCAQPDSYTGVHTWSPAVQLQFEEQVGERGVEVEVDACLLILPNHADLL